MAAFLGEALRRAGVAGDTLHIRHHQALWAPWVLHAGLGPENAFSGQIAKVIAFALEAAGAPVVKGGAKNLLAAFKALITGTGRRDPTGADALRSSSNGRATGVRLASAVRRSRRRRA